MICFSPSFSNARKREIDTESEKKDVARFAGDGGAADAAQIPRVDGRPPVAGRAQGFVFEGKGK